MHNIEVIRVDLQNKLEQIKAKKRQLIQDKDMLLMKKETIEKFQTPALRKKFF